MKAKRTFRNTLAILMVFTMLLGCGGLSALAGDVIDVDDGTEHPPYQLSDVTDTSNYVALDVNVENSGSVANVTVDGGVSSLQPNDFAAINITAEQYGEGSVTVNGNVTAEGSGAEGYAVDVYALEPSSSASLTVNGSLDVTNTLAGGYEGTDFNTGGLGVLAQGDSSASGSISEDINVTSAFGAYGVAASSETLSTSEATVGSVDVNAGNASAYGVNAYAEGSSETSVTVTGSSDDGNAVSASSVSGNASGVKATASGGSGSTITVESGSIEATTSSGNATAVTATASAGSESTVTVESGNVEANTASGQQAIGIDISSEDSSSKATVEVLSGGVIVEGGSMVNIGVDARGTNGTSAINVKGDIEATGSDPLGLYEDGSGDLKGTAGDFGEVGSITVHGEGNTMATGVRLSPGEDGSAALNVNGGISADSEDGSASAVLVRGDQFFESPVGEVRLNVNGDINADSEYLAHGIDVYNANGQDTEINVSGNITANTDSDELNYAFGIGVTVCDAEVDINVDGNVTSNGDGIRAQQMFNTATTSDVEIGIHGNVDAGQDGIKLVENGKSGKYEVKVEGDEIADPEKGNVKGGRYGLNVSTIGADNDTLADIVVSGTLEGDEAPIILNGGFTPDNLKLTVFQVKLDKDGHAVVGANVDGSTYSNETTEKMEKESILYIIKVQQPEGAVLKATKEDGSDLDESHDYQVAKEGETILMKVDLAKGYKVTGAYSVDGNEKLNIIEKDGQYYVEVPKGGDVWLSARVEKASDDSGANDDNGGSWYGGTAIAGRVQYVDVTFDFNGGHKLSGSTAPIVKTVPVGTWVVLVQAPLKDGAQFLGWKADKAGITVSKPGDNFCAWEPVTFTAMWSDTSAAAANTAAVTLQPAAGESAAQTVSAVQSAPTVALSEDASLTLADLLGSASPTGEGSALQAKLVVDLPNGGSMEIPVNIQLSFGTPTIIDNP